MISGSQNASWCSDSDTEQHPSSDKPDERRAARPAKISQEQQQQKIAIFVKRPTRTPHFSPRHQTFTFNRVTF